VLVLVTGCVAGAEQRPTSAETAAGVPPIPSPPTAGGLLAGAAKTPADPPPGPSPGPGFVSVRGYWHWTGVRYVWMPAHWEPRDRAYAPAIGR